MASQNPELQNRGVWIFVGLSLLILCCCAASVVLAATGVISAVSSSLDGFPLLLRESAEHGGERIERSFDVGGAPRLEIDNFAGSVTVRAGEGDTIHVAATKQVRRASDLERIEVNTSERDGGLVIKTKRPSGLSGASVKLEIITPTDTRLDLDTGAGQVNVHGLRNGVEAHSGSGNIDVSELGGTVLLDTGSGSLTIHRLDGSLEADTGSGGVVMKEVRGDIEAHTGSGGMEVYEAEGRVQLDTGSGGIRYEGKPEGDCRFETGSGSITLVLPAELDMKVELSTGSGGISVEYDVMGRMTRTEVSGIIGGGGEGLIDAHTGSGSIELMRR